MTGTTPLLLLAAAAACFNAGLHWYTQVATGAPYVGHAFATPRLSRAVR